MPMNLTWSSLNAFSGHMAAFAWQVLWQSSLLIVAIWVIDVSLKRRLSASVRYGLWLLALLKLLLPPSIAFPSGLAWWLWPQVPQTYASPSLSPKVEVRYLAGSASAAIPRDGGKPPTLLSQGCSITTIAVGCSCLISVGLVGWMCYRQRQVSWLLRHASIAPEPVQALLKEAQACFKLTGRVPLLVTPQPVSPALCGLLRPTIVLPEGLTKELSPEQLYSVLLHELAHLKRHDAWTSCLQSLVQVVYWWHPLLWLANARIGRLREEAVDDAVLAALSEQSPNYAPALLEVARLVLPRPVAAPGFVGIVESPSTLRARIQRVLNAEAPKKREGSILGLLCIAGFGAIALPMGPAPGPEPQQTPPAIPESSSEMSARLTQDAKLLYEMGKLEEAKAKLLTVIRQSPTNRAAYYYLNLINEAEFRKQPIATVPKSAPSSNPPSTEALYTRVFKVDPEIFTASILGPSGSGSNRTADASEGVHAFFESIGVNLQPPKTIYFKETEGWLLVRATLSDLDKIEQAISQLSPPPLQINTRIQAAQLSPSQAAIFWSRVPLQNPTDKTVILEPAEARRQFARLTALAAPEALQGLKERIQRIGIPSQNETGQTSITTGSGKQAQIQIGDTIAVITASNGPGSSPPGATQTNEVPVGLRVDLQPFVGSDSYTVSMRISAFFTEFLGYDNPPPSATAPLPVPHLRVRQIGLRPVSVADGQTVVLGGSEEFNTQLALYSQQVPLLGDLPLIGRLFRSRSEPEKELILFITPTIIDSMGNPIHPQSY